MSDSQDEKSIKMDKEKLQLYCQCMKQRAQIYKEETAKLELIFERMKLFNEERKLPESVMNKVTEAENIWQTKLKEVCLNKVDLEQAETFRKQQNYAPKLKLCISYYSNLNENLTKQINLFKKELNLSKENIEQMHSKEDVKQLEEKAKKYEDQLLKLEKKYPWLKNSEYDLLNIENHIDILKSLKEEKEALLKDLSQYQNLAPDITEAKQQLRTLKDDIKVLMDKMKSDQII